MRLRIAKELPNDRAEETVDESLLIDRLNELDKMNVKFVVVKA